MRSHMKQYYTLLNLLPRHLKLKLIRKLVVFDFISENVNKGNSVFLVTGGASDDYGRATVEKLLKEGARVIISDPPTKTLHIYGDEKAIFLPINIHIEDDVKTLISIIKEKFGRLDGVINCIDYYKTVPVFDVKEKCAHSLQEFSKIIHENLVGLFNILRFVVPLIAQNAPKRKSGRGIIINMTSLSALDGHKFTCAYSASKAAVIGMTEAMACELEALRIRCISIAIKPLGVLAIPSDTSRFFDSHNGLPELTEEPTKFAQLIKTVIELPMINTSLIKMDGL